MDNSKLLAFMFHDNTEDYIQIEDVLDMLKEYDVGNYIIALENEPYRHFHICCELEINKYNAFVKKHLKDRLKLRGRAVNGQPRQYGRVLGIKKPDKMIAYTLKQGVYITSLTEATVKPYKKMSYVKDSGDNDREIRDNLREFIDKVRYADLFKKITEQQLKMSIIHFLLKEKIRIRTSSQIDGYYKYLRQFSNHDYIKWDNELDFYDYLYNQF